MTDKQPEALQHAARLERSPQLFDREAAAELRRLHEVNAELVEALKDILGELSDGFEPHQLFILRAKAALAKATGENND